MGAHSRPRKGFNKTMAVAIAAGMTITGGVQVAAPAGSTFAASAHAATLEQAQNGSVLPTTPDDTLEVQTTFRDAGENYIMDIHVFTPDLQKYGIKSKSTGTLYEGGYQRFNIYPGKYYPEMEQPRARFSEWSKFVNDRPKWTAAELHPVDAATGKPSQKVKVVNDGTIIGVARDKPLFFVPSRTPVHPSGKTDTSYSNGQTGESFTGGGGATTNGYASDAASFVVSGARGATATPIAGVRYGFQIENYAVIPKAYLEANGMKPSDFKVSVFGATPSPGHGLEGGTYNVRTTYAATKTDADTNDPRGKKVSVNQNKPVPDAETAIANTNELKNVKTITWKTTPSTAKVGPSKQTVVVEYNDGSKDEVVVDFEVTKSTTNADDNQPVPVAQNVKYGDPVVKDANKLFSNWAKMPKGTTATPVDPPAKVTKPVDVTYTIKYPDGSSEQVKVKHTPGKMSDAYDPKGKDVKTGLNGKPGAKEGIANIGDMPQGTTYEWKGGAPKTSERGKFPATVVVKYSDGSTDEVAVNVVVTATDAEVNTPKPKPIVVDNGVKPMPEDGIGNKDQLPDKTKYTWKKEPDTTKPGNTDGVITVTYPDGSTDDVTVPVTVKPIADNYDPQPKPITVNSGATPKPEDGIANKDKLPKDATYKWEKTPDTSKPGTTDSVVIVTYKDGSTDRVTVPVTVRSMAEVYNPVPQDVTVNRTKQPNAADAIKNKQDLPEGTEYTWKSPVDTSTGGTKPAVVVVTYPDGSSEEVSTNVIVRPDNEVYTPQPKPIVVDNGSKPNPADGIANKDKLPKDTKYTWEKAPDTSKPGKTEGVVTVTYPDGSTDRVTVPVTVRTQAEQFDPKPKPIESWTNENPPAIDGIMDPDKLPKGTKFEWEKEPDTAKPGDTSGVVKVTYPDGSTDRVTVPVRVFLSGDDYQKIQGDIDNLKKEIDRINGEIGKLKGDVNTLKTQMKKAQEDIARLKAQVKDLEDRMKAAEKRLDGHDKDIADLKRRMADAERRLDNIDKQIAQILAELERLDGNEIVKGVRNADNSITLVKKDGRTVEIPPATKYGLEQCTAQLGGGLMALVPTLIVLSQVGNAVHLPGFEQQMIAMQKQAGMYNPQIADFVSKHGPALAAGAVGLAVIGTMFIPGTCGDKSIADALGESLRGNANAVNPNVRETHELNGSSRFVPKQGSEGKQGTEGNTATAGSSMNIGKGDQPDKPAEQPASSSSDKGAEKEAGTAAGAPAPETANGNATADVLEDIASLAETGEDTEDFGLAVADAFATK